MNSDMLTETPLHGFVCDSLGLEPRQISPLPGGRNNRVYKVQTDQGDFLLKSYFSHPLDSRCRLQSEYSFSSYAWQQGCRQIPQPLAQDVEQSLALFQFIEGRKLHPDEVNVEHVNAALDFVMAVNKHVSSDSKAIGPASESCASFVDHLNCVDERIARFQALDVQSELQGRVKRFIEKQLSPAWEDIKKTVIATLVAQGKDLGLSFGRSELCLSPSDFGFHNALLDAHGNLVFFDFEYAGWDDPVKCICDFMCQPQIPVPYSCREFILTKFSKLSHQPEAFIETVECLYPVHRLKWCFIMLNDFLTVGDSRRQFAMKAITAEHRQEVQLESAKRYFAQGMVFSDDGRVL